MTSTDLDLLQAMDPAVFARECGIINPDPSQAEILRYEGDRLMLNCTRQYGKSTVIAHKAYHKATYDPSSLVLLLSPSLRQSSELFRKVLDVDNAYGIRLKKVEDSKLYMTLENGSRIISLPGKEGTIRGYSGAALIIIDEAAQVLDNLYLSIKPMLAVSHGSLILMSTPHGKRGFFFHEWDEAAGWEKVMITAAECPRITPEFLAQEKESMPERWYRQEYFCEFVETEDQVFPYDLIAEAFQHGVKPLYSDIVSDAIKPMEFG